MEPSGLKWEPGAWCLESAILSRMLLPCWPSPPPAAPLAAPLIPLFSGVPLGQCVLGSSPAVLLGLSVSVLPPSSSPTAIQSGVPSEKSGGTR